MPGFLEFPDRHHYPGSEVIIPGYSKYSPGKVVVFREDDAATQGPGLLGL